jgi:type VI secretion system protein ImpJ
MINAHEIPAIIQWHEGMLLAPQHFQQLSWRYEALLQYHTAAIAPFHWGVRRCQIDTALLVSGILRILQLEAVLPDGLVVSHGDHNAEALEIDLTPYAEDMRRQGLAVRLAVPAKKPGEPSAKGDLARYVSRESDPVADENTGMDALGIPRLWPRLSLLVAEPPPAKYVTLPLARVQYRNEAFALNDYIPPTLSVPVSSALGEMCTLIARRVREKALFLSEQVRAPSVAIGAPLVLETKTFIQSLVAALPHFEAVLSTGLAHPYTLYLALCLLAGHVAAVGAGVLPPAFVPYNHNDLRATFTQVRDFIYRALDEGIPEIYAGMPFSYDHGVFSLTFDGAWLQRRLILGVRGQTGMSEKDVIDWMELSLIGSRTVMPVLRERRILGAARHRIEGDADLVPVRGVILFALHPDPSFIHPDEALQIFNAQDPDGAARPAEIVLYVKRAAG